MKFGRVMMRPHDGTAPSSAFLQGLRRAVKGLSILIILNELMGTRGCQNTNLRAKKDTDTCRCFVSDDRQVPCLTFGYGYLLRNPDYCLQYIRILIRLSCLIEIPQVLQTEQ